MGDTERESNPLPGLLVPKQYLSPLVTPWYQFILLLCEDNISFFL